MEDTPCRKCGAVGVRMAPPFRGHPRTICWDCAYPPGVSTVNAETGELRCGKCRRWKDPQAFKQASPRDQQMRCIKLRGGKRNRCTDCCNEDNREYRLTHSWGETVRVSRAPFNSRRKYFPKAGDAVYVDGVQPSTDGVIVSSCEATATCRVLIYGSEILDLRWRDVRDLKAKNEANRKCKNRKRGKADGRDT